MDFTATYPNSLPELTLPECEAPLLRIDLSVSFPRTGARTVLRGTSLEVRQGEILGLVGSSGSGKSTMALAILRLLSLKGGHVSGTLCFEGRDLMSASESEMRRLRGRVIALVPQSASSALNPSLTIGSQFREAWLAHSTDRGGWKPRVLELLQKVSLPDDESFLKLYPRQLSVGMAQRVLIAMAVLHQPRLLIADEPTSALDVITQAEVLQLFRTLNQEWNMTTLCISHDLLSVARLCHRIAIIDQGRIVECDTPAAIFHSARHPYTQRLVQAMPKPF